MNTNVELPLRDIHLPNAISWWPLAPGWWLLFISILLIIILVFIITKKILQPTLRKQASKTLDSIEQAFHINADATQCLTELSMFLRRVVLSQAPKDGSAGTHHKHLILLNLGNTKNPWLHNPNVPSLSVCSITGMDWLMLLDQKLDKPEFSQGVGRLLLNGPYQPHIETEDITQLIKLCRKWVNRL